eukprot:sb/3474867/
MRRNKNLNSQSERNISRYFLEPFTGRERGSTKATLNVISCCQANALTTVLARENGSGQCSDRYVVSNIILFQTWNSILLTGDQVQVRIFCPGAVKTLPNIPAMICQLGYRHLVISVATAKWLVISMFCIVQT